MDCEQHSSCEDDLNQGGSDTQRHGGLSVRAEPHQHPNSPAFAFPYPSPALPTAALPIPSSHRGPSAETPSTSSPQATRPVLPAGPGECDAGGLRTAQYNSDGAAQDGPHLPHHHHYEQKGGAILQHRWRKAAGSEKLVLVLVGLPARGKSYIAHKLVSYLNWTGRRARLFNVGAFRRLSLQASSPTPPGDGPPSGTQLRHSSDFFSHTNVSGRAKRDELAFAVLADLLQWLDTEGDVAVFDATNTTKDRRRAVFERCRAHSRTINIIFIESICDDKEVLQSNFLQKIRNSPDYRDMPEEEAIKDLQARIRNYESVYQTVEDDEQLSYIKLINLQSKVICNRIYGKMAQKIVGFLMAIHVGNRPIWLTRAGHCDGVEDLDPIHETYETNDASVHGSPVGKSRAKFPSIASMTAQLSQEGQQFANRLDAFISNYTRRQCAECSLDDVPCPVLVYTSTLPRALETVKALSIPEHCIERLSSLKMINTGVCSGLSVKEMMEKMPAEWEAWRKDPFRYRFAGGESYKDVVQNVESLVLDLERQTTPMLVVSHLSTLQVLFGYFVGCPADRFATLSIPRHTVVQLTPNQYGWKVDLIPLGPLAFSSSGSSSVSSPLSRAIAAVRQYDSSNHPAWQPMPGQRTPEPQVKLVVTKLDDEEEEHTIRTEGEGGVV